MLRITILNKLLVIEFVLKNKVRRKNDKIRGRKNKKVRSLN
jgi:hypothetical protein